MEAIVNRHEGVALHLLQLGADVAENNINGDQALHLAAEKDLAAVFIEVMNAHEDALFQYNDVRAFYLLIIEWGTCLIQDLNTVGRAQSIPVCRVSRERLRFGGNIGVLQKR
jgi:hypothetical protein